ncbi:hypothetical protein CLF_102257 [Clonorchis sinensis]|uniref:Uncharacterized protein n=1 Tax=Clonorchis sinensis TaxID=79923 RepID=G7Y7L6_CLOSI|nr:hypothetical protein CLF_102257 [Clonorchis sinensis]
MSSKKDDIGSGCRGVLSNILDDQLEAKLIQRHKPILWTDGFTQTDHQICKVYIRPEKYDRIQVLCNVSETQHTPIEIGNKLNTKCPTEIVSGRDKNLEVTRCESKTSSGMFNDSYFMPHVGHINRDLSVGLRSFRIPIGTVEVFNQILQQHLIRMQVVLKVCVTLSSTGCRTRLAASGKPARSFPYNVSKQSLEIYVFYFSNHTTEYYGDIDSRLFIETLTFIRTDRQDLDNSVNEHTE